MQEESAMPEEWKSCITAGGGIETRDAVRDRVAVLSNPDHPEAMRFVESYGSEHLRQVLVWLQRQEMELWL